MTTAGICDAGLLGVRGAASVRVRALMSFYDPLRSPTLTIVTYR